MNMPAISSNGITIMNDLAYLLSALLAVAAYVVAGVALWLVVEGGYWLWCKVTGREY